VAIFCFSIGVSYSKGVCQHCGGHIEFPTEGAGQTIPCPHCQWNTVLTVSHAPSVEVGGGPGLRKRVFLGFGVAAAVVAAAGVGVFLWLKHTDVGTQPSEQNPGAITASGGTAPIPPAKPVPPPDPWHGLKAGKVSLEKPGDGRLVYAVGTLRNTSDHQRFGVKVELDVLDAQGDKLGSATDYTQVMEPGKEWKFKALVTDRNAATAKLIDIKEQD
jgi:hypothetical protein